MRHCAEHRPSFEIWLKVKVNKILKNYLDLKVGETQANFQIDSMNLLRRNVEQSKILAYQDKTERKSERLAQANFSKL